MPMFSNRDLVATGMLLRNPGRQPTGLLISELTATTQPPTGAAFPPLADWIAIAAPQGDLPDQPDAWIRRLQPSFAQMLVILLIGMGADRRAWRGWTTE